MSNNILAKGDEMGAATLVKSALPNFRGDARLYRLDPPLVSKSWDDEVTGRHEYVVVSGVVVPFGSGPETYIFAADTEGEIENWMELNGSFRGEIDHERALKYAGYEVVA